MPAALVGAVRFPSVYQPWYVYVASLVTTRTAAFTYGDLLIPNSSGLFDNVAASSTSLATGYAFALDADDGVMTTVQVAMPGSAMPMVAKDTTILPGCLVKLSVTSTVQTIVLAAATDLAAGYVVGRYRCHHQDHEELRESAASDIIVVNTGLC